MFLGGTDSSAFPCRQGNKMAMAPLDSGQKWSRHRPSLKLRKFFEQLSCGVVILAHNFPSNPILCGALVLAWILITGIPGPLRLHLVFNPWARILHGFLDKESFDLISIHLAAIAGLHSMMYPHLVTACHHYRWYDLVSIVRRRGSTWGTGVLNP